MSEALKLAEKIESAAAFPAYPRAPYAEAAAMLKAQAAELEALRAECDALKLMLSGTAGCVRSSGRKTNLAWSFGLKTTLFWVRSFPA